MYSTTIHYKFITALCFCFLLSVRAYAFEHWQVYGTSIPGVLTLSGNFLLLNNVDNVDPHISRLITVFDITEPGKEVVIDTIEAPDRVLAMEVVDNRLYTMSQDRRILYVLDFATGQWGTISLNGRSDDFNYRRVLFPDADRGLLYVVHYSALPQVVDVVDMAKQQVIHSFPLSGAYLIAARTGDYLVTLSRGLEQFPPTCTSRGPTLALHRLPFGEQVYALDVSGDCPQTLVIAEGTIYLIYLEEVRAYALETGDFLGRMLAPAPLQFGRQALWRNGNLIIQSNEHILLIDAGLTGIWAQYDLVWRSRQWIPPLEQMHYEAATDRIFVANRNDDALSIVRLGF